MRFGIPGMLQLNPDMVRTTAMGMAKRGFPKISGIYPGKKMSINMPGMGPGGGMKMPGMGMPRLPGISGVPRIGKF